MTRNITIAANASPPNLRPEDASTNAAAKERSQPPASTQALKDQVSTDATAALPFQRLRRNADALPEKQDKNDWAGLQDFAAVPIADAEKYFTCFQEARKFAKDSPILSKDPRATVAAAQLHRSKAASRPEQHEAAQSAAKTSVQARIRKTAISAEGQKRFFEDYAARNGYPSAEVSPIDDETFLQNWQMLRSGAMKEKDFIAPLMSVPREQRLSVALNLARLVAREHLIEFREFENENLERLDNEMNDARDALRESTPGSAEEKRLIAKLNNLGAAYEAEISTLTDDGIKTGSEALERLLGPGMESTYKRQSARLSWTPCDDWNEVDNIVSVFKDACEAYNAQTELRKKGLLMQNGVMQDSALPLLGMPLELRGDPLAKSVHSHAQQNFLESHGLAEPQTLSGKAWQALKVIGAALGYTFGLGWFFSSVHDALMPTLSQQERLRLANEHADKAVLNFLQDHNRRLAEEWVKDQYSKSAPSGPDGLHYDANDPHGLFAAILNPRNEEPSNDFFTREKLIEDVNGQLYLAAKSDILTTKEKLAATLNIPVTDNSIIIDDEDYSYLQTIARSIVDGIAVGLHWSAQQHQPSANAPKIQHL